MIGTIVLANHKGVDLSTSARNIVLGLMYVLRHMKAPNSRVLLIDTNGIAKKIRQAVRDEIEHAEQRGTLGDSHIVLASSTSPLMFTAKRHPFALARITCVSWDSAREIFPNGANSIWDGAIE